MRQSAYFISGTSVRENEPLFNTFLGTFHLHKLSDTLLGECNYHSSLHGLKWFKYVHAYIFKRTTIHDVEEFYRHCVDVFIEKPLLIHKFVLSNWRTVNISISVQSGDDYTIYIVNLISDIRYLMDTFNNVHL